MNPNYDSYRAARLAQKTGTARLWAAMRILRQFSAPELAAICEMAHINTARSYLSRLCGAGFLRVVDAPHRRAGTCWTYRLIRNTGPVAPSQSGRRHVLIDHNTNTEYSYAKRK
jgi:hypothetical protein